MNNRAAFGGCFNVNDSRQIVVINRDQIDCVSGGVTTGGNDRGDGVADKIDFVLSQHAIVRHLQTWQGAGAGHRTNLSATSLPV